MPYFSPCHITTYGVIPKLHPYLELDGISISQVIDIVRARPVVVPKIPGKPNIVGIRGKLTDGRTISLGVIPSGMTTEGCTREVMVTHYRVFRPG